jgi:arylsulfatase A-like enzyme
MIGRDDQAPSPADAVVATDPTSPMLPRSASSDSTIYHPSKAFRRILNQDIRDGQASEVASETAPSKPARAPSLTAVIAAALAIGVVSGFLELSVLLAQLHGLRYVDWSTLMISRHIGWMIPITGAAIIVVLTILLVGPALAWDAWRRKGPEMGNAAGWAWAWAGWVLATLFLLGPLLTIRGFHFAAPLAVALGVGFRTRRCLVRPSPGWPRSTYRAAGIAVGVLGFHLAWQCNASPSAPVPTGSQSGAHAPNLLWIVLDTLRADRMSLHGYQRPTTPALETWARQGIAFDRARSAAPWTLPSHVSMFTGLWPSEHGACIDTPYYGSSPTLAEHLRAKGYATGGVSANVRMCNAAYGVGRGFDWYVDYPCKHEISLKAAMSNSALGSYLMELGRRMCLPVPSPYPFSYRRSARAIAADGRVWLDSVRRPGEGGPSGSHRPFFLFLNFMDAHGPYLPPPDAPRRFWTGPVPSKRDARPEDGWLALQARDVATQEERPQRQQELETVRHRLGDLYDDCVGGLDAQLGRFLSGLRDAGLLANTWVVITADHGEHFGEHGQFGHGSSLYNELTHVPLVLIPPLGAGPSRSDPYAMLRNQRIRVPVSLRDLPRTFTDLLLPGTENPFPGRSLARYWRTDRPEIPDPVLSQLEQPRLKGNDFRTNEVTRIESIIEDDRILIEYSDRPSELFALVEDPEQLRNLAEVASEKAQHDRLRRTLDAIRRANDNP